ncbi:FHA domain-containing protein [Nocardia sp. CA-128927]|uniref:FHA domain-containing protein n=1 Tax=Nocardia sp. CA-128927 TaxID=3239975 RepID=UPI003D96684D
MSTQIEVLPGGHLVAGAGGVVVVVAHRVQGAVTADSVAARAMTELLGIVRQASSQEPRRRGRTVARMATNWLMGLENGDEDEVEFGVITPGDGGIAVFLHGGVTAVLAGAERSEILRGREAGFTIDRVVTPAPGIGAGLFVDEVGREGEMLPARGVFALGEGTAPGAGAVLWLSAAGDDAAAEVPHSWFEPRHGAEQQDVRRVAEPYPVSEPQRVYDPQPVSEHRDVFEPQRVSEHHDGPAPQGGSEPHHMPEPERLPDLRKRDESLDALTENYSTSPISREAPAASTGGEPRRYGASAHAAVESSSAAHYPGEAIPGPLGEDSSPRVGGASSGRRFPGPASTESSYDDSSPLAGEPPSSPRFPGDPVSGSAGSVGESSAPLAGEPSSWSRDVPGGTGPIEGSSSMSGPSPRVPVTPPRPQQSYPAADAEWSDDSSPVSGAPDSYGANAEWPSEESPSVSPATPHVAMPNLQKPAGTGESEKVAQAYSGEQPGVAQHDSGAHDQVQDPVRNIEFEETMVPAETMVSRILDHAALESIDPGVVVKGFKCARDHLNDPRVSFCAVCGIRMDQLTCVLTDGVRPPLGLLLLDDGTSFVLDNDCVLGREPEHAEAVAHGARPVRLEDLSGGMSRAHAEIRLIDWDVTVVDGGSTNGTHVRQPGHQDWTRAIPGHPVKLTPGAQVQLGGRVVTFDSQHGQL